MRNISTEESIRPIYAEKDDMTFIMKSHVETEKNDAGEIISRKETMTVVGWYFGEPSVDATLDYIGDLTATMEY